MFLICSTLSNALDWEAMAGIKRGQLDAEERRLRSTKLGELAEAGIAVFCWCHRRGPHAVVGNPRLAAALGHAYSDRERVRLGKSVDLRCVPIIKEKKQR